MTLKKFQRLLITIGIITLLVLLIDKFLISDETEKDFPGKPIKIIVPFKPGGGSDRIARTVDRFTEKEFGRQFIFDYKSGGGGHLGIGYLAKSIPNGYMIGTYNTPDVALGPLTGAAQYSLDDLEFLGQVSFDPVLFATRVASRNKNTFKDMRSFIKHARKNPGSLSLGIAGARGGNHLATLAMLEREKVKVRIVLFAGGSELATAVLGGQVEAGASGISPFLGSIEKVRFLACAGKNRHPKLPDISTMAEQGIVMETGIGRVFMTPKGIPGDVLEYLRKGLKSIFDSEEFKEEMIKIGREPVWLDGDEIKKQMEEFSVTAGKLIEKFNL